MLMEFQGCLMQVHFTEIHQIFTKKKMSDTFLTRGKESTEVQITQNKGKENENSYQKL